MAPPAFTKFSINSLSGAKPSSYVLGITLLRQAHPLGAEKNQGLLIGSGSGIGDDETNGRLVGIVLSVTQTNTELSSSSHFRALAVGCWSGKKRCDARCISVPRVGC